MTPKNKTDWDKIGSFADEDIDAQIAANPDAAPVLNWDEVAFVKVCPKKAISIRLDRDIIDFFKLQGPGYQSRIGDVLRSYVDHQQSK